MAFVTVVLNQKGGIGKSTITVNLAATIAEVLGGLDGEAAPVAAVSIDPQGSTVWWAERVGDDLPFVFVDAYDDAEGIKKLREATAVQHVLVDTPGWMDPAAREKGSGDPLGTGPVADSIRAALDNAGHVIVPIEPESLGWMPTKSTIEQILKPRGIPYTVVISNWDPRDGKADLDDTRDFVRRNGWPLARTVIRHYKLHTRAAAEGQVVTRYPKSRVAQECLQDFTNLALELQLRFVQAKAGA
uniref:ParA family protein n=1 Tax=Kitasatospora indigofera TaxID=67307 RepID=UPI002F90C943